MHYLSNEYKINRNFSLFPTLFEIKRIIALFDYDFDCCLCYNEFLKLILPIKSNSLTYSPKENHLINNFTKLPFDIEFSLCKLFEKLLELVRNMSYLLKGIDESSLFEVFSSMDPNNTFSIPYTK
jgi:hypothetical protein